MVLSARLFSTGFSFTGSWISISVGFAKWAEFWGLLSVGLVGRSEKYQDIKELCLVWFVYYIPSITGEH